MASALKTASALLRKMWITTQERYLSRKQSLRVLSPDVARFRELYGKSFGQQRSSYYGEWKGATRALNEEKAALFGLTSQQTEAKIKS